MLNLKRKTKTIVACSVLLSLLILSSWSLLDPTYYIFESNPLISPKTASNEISIIIPENKAYNAPMSGYYPATYGFEEDQISTSGTDINFIDSKEAGAVATIVVEADYHKNILRYSTPSDFEAIWDDLSDNQSTGTVEFWINCAETNERHELIIQGPMGNRILFNFYSNGMVEYLSYSIWYPICSYEANRWYHVRITFDCNIYGDGTNDWHLWIDGVNMDGGAGYEYDGAPMKMNQVLFQGTSGADFDIDAVGYSWDPNYNIGDNLDEGLLLSFESTIALDWIGYSLDGQPTKTILGDTTIPFPESGTHNIQVFGNDSLGTMYASDLRHFTITFIIDIITPESKTYTAPMAGYYPATYGFESDDSGSMPRDWVKKKPYGGNADAYVVDSAYGHNKVIKLYDPLQGWFYPTFVQVKNSFAPQNEGTIDFHLYYTNIVYINLLYVNENPEYTVEVVKIRFGPDAVYYWKDDQFIPIFGLPALIANRWYHCQLHFKSNSKWKLTVNDNSMPYREYSNSGYSINAFMISTDPFYFNYNTYIDSVGYSWDPYYDVEDNKYEGLFLEFNPDGLYDMSYTLDGVSRTIYGDIVFPMPKSGPHTISVHGTDQYGLDYWGESSFSVQYEERFGIFMWASDAADGPDAWPPFVWAEAVEGNMHQYRDILYDEGFRKFYFYRDVDDGDEYEAIMDRLERRIDINDQVFFYIRGHGYHDKYNDYVYISPPHQGGNILELNIFREDIAEFESIYKGVLVEACYSGKWPKEIPGYASVVVVLSSCDIDQLSEVDTISHQGFFSLHFWAAVQRGDDAREAYYYAKYMCMLAGEQTPQGYINEDPTFMFFD